MRLSMVMLKGQCDSDGQGAALVGAGDEAEQQLSAPPAPLNVGAAAAAVGCPLVEVANA